MSLSASSIADWRCMLVLLCVGGCHPRADPVVAKPAPAIDAARVERRVLATFAAPPYTYEVSVLHRSPEQARLDAKRYGSDGGIDPFSIRLLEAGRELDQQLVFQTSCAQSSVRPVDGVRGGDTASASWTTEYEHCDTRIAARSIALAKGQTGLLLTQATGYEYRYSNQLLLLGERGRLRLLWSYDEDTTGLDRSSTSAIPSDSAEREDIAFIVARRGSTGAVAEFKAQRLRFDPERAAILASPLPDENAPLYVVVLGDFATAKPALETTPHCLDELDVMDRALFPTLSLPHFYFGAAFARRRDAEAVVAEIAECSASYQASIFEQPSTPGGQHAGAR